MHVTKDLAKSEYDWWSGFVAGALIGALLTVLVISVLLT
jgi:hypothetical protein